MKLFSTQVNVRSEKPAGNGSLTVTLFNLDNVDCGPLAAINDTLASSSGLTLKYLRELAGDYAEKTGKGFMVRAAADKVGIWVHGNNPAASVGIVLMPLDVLKDFIGTLTNSRARDRLLAFYGRLVASVGKKPKYTFVQTVVTYQRAHYKARKPAVAEPKADKAGLALLAEAAPVAPPASSDVITAENLLLKLNNMQSIVANACSKLAEQLMEVQTLLGVEVSYPVTEAFTEAEAPKAKKCCGNRCGK